MGTIKNINKNFMAANHLKIYTNYIIYKTIIEIYRCNIQLCISLRQKKEQYKQRHPGIFYN